MIVVHDSKQSRHRCQVVIWWLALQEFDDCASYAPYVGRRGRTGELNDLGRHPIRRAHHLGLLVRPGKRTGGYAEVSKLDCTVFGRQDVGALYVPVYDTLVVQILKSLEHLCHVHADEVLGKLSVRFADGMQRSILAISRGPMISKTSPSLESVVGRTNSRMMFKYSAVLLNPIYLTMLSC